MMTIYRLENTIEPTRSAKILLKLIRFQGMRRENPSSNNWAIKREIKSLPVL